MKKAINISVFLLSLAIPATCMIVIAEISKFNLTPFIPMFGFLIASFGYEVMQSQLGKKYVRTHLSTLQGKASFLLGMTGLWFLISLAMFIGTSR